VIENTKAMPVYDSTHSAKNFSNQSLINKHVIKSSACNFSKHANLIEIYAWPHKCILLAFLGPGLMQIAAVAEQDSHKMLHNNTVLFN